MRQVRDDDEDTLDRLDKTIRPLKKVTEGYNDT
jgi:hypothetical protein